MADSPKAHAIRHVASPTSSSPAAQALSPLVQLLPTGYRDIQPFQKGKGWHTNGPAGKQQPSKFRRPRDAIAAEHGSSNGERVVFPVIPTHEGEHAAAEQMSAGAAGGPRLSGAGMHDIDERQESDDSGRHDDDEHKPAVRTLSPSIASIPVPPSAPRRPSRGENNQSTGPLSSSSSFRTRTIAAAAGNSSSSGSTQARPSSSSDSASPSPAQQQQHLSSRQSSAEEIDSPSSQVPDPELVAKLWQEYAERTKSKSVDKESYHRKMQHKYNELRIMRERISRLEIELLDTQRERDEAREAASRSVQQSVVSRWKDSESSEELGSEGSGFQPQQHQHQQQQTRSLSSPKLVTRKSMLKVLQNLSSPEEVSYREKCFKLERALSSTKATMSETQAASSEQRDKNREIINALQAKLLLEQEASQLLSKQLHEASVAFKTTADELVATQIELEKEQIHKNIVMEQIQQQTNQLITDHRRKELQNRVRNVIRNLGKEALHLKMEALHTRVLVAEQQMRKAQLQVTSLEAERHAQQQQLEQILSSSALKYHSLAADGGVPGILQRAEQLFYGSRVVTNQVLMLQILYEDQRTPRSCYRDGDHQIDALGNEAFRMHFVCYEAFTAQDDFLTFQLRDIKRLVPNHENYLALYADRKRERLRELAEILFTHVHAGYKNGHLVITEIPPPSLSMAVATQAVGGTLEESERREVSIYRATRFVALQPSSTSEQDGGSSAVLAELVVNEVCAASTSELWWLEIRALVIESDGLLHSEESEFVAKVDLHQLRSVCTHFGSYRPSESIVVAKHERDSRDVNGDNEVGAASEIFSIHEEILEPVLSKLVLVSSRDGSNTSVRDLSGAEEPTADRRVQLVLDLPGTADQALAQSSSTNEPRLSSAMSRIFDNPSFEPTSANANTEAQDDADESVLDHRCIVNISDVFYCVHIQEIWDAELMLEVSMEDPEMLSKFHRVIHESELMEIARFLFESGLVDENCSSQVKNGLPRKLRMPICRLLKKHMQPVVAIDATDTSESSHGDSTSGAISIALLTKELSSQKKQKAAADTANELQLDAASFVSTSSNQINLMPLEGDLSRDVVENITLQFADRFASRARQHDFGDPDGVQQQSNPMLQRARRGCRSVRDSDARFAVVEIWSGFQGFHGFVLEVFPVSSAIDSDSATASLAPENQSQSSKPRVVTAKPLNEALEALGLAFSSA